MNTVPHTANASARPAPLAQMRSSASWFVGQATLPGHQTVLGFVDEFQADLEWLVPRVEQLAAALPEGDGPARMALAGVSEARQRLDLPEASGLQGEVRRVERLARSVLALCDHHDVLTGMVRCLVCDQRIEDDAWTPYDKVSPSGGAIRAGRIHQGCAP
ncbi:DUF6415 family natural product biosynthesis protein [Streptomyces broussonetiae]|uniref:DUF6415 family natural product biosynthesis protein n=1 Tax=Streptomyces broussonetiae TaxID=2686304 RepID=A0ABV5EM85_9ACTN